MKSAIALLLLAGAILGSACSSVDAATSAPSAAAPDAKNATYQFDKTTITLANGHAEREAAPGSATKQVVDLGVPSASGDVDGDGKADAIVILTSQPGGSGTFAYLGVVRASGGAAPTALLGDRIKVTAVRFDAKAIVVETLDRPAGAPLTASPSVVVLRRFTFTGGALTAQ